MSCQSCSSQTTLHTSRVSSLTRITFPNFRMAAYLASRGDMPRSMLSCVSRSTWSRISWSSSPSMRLRCVMFRPPAPLDAESAKSLTGLPERWSFVSQRHCRINAHRPTRRYVASQQCDEREQNGHARERFEISRADSVKQAGHQPRKPERRDNADGNPDTGEFQALANDEPENVAPGRAKRHANANLMSALRHGIRNDAVDSNGSENQCESAKQAEQYQGHSARRDRIVSQFFHGRYGENGLVLINRLNGFANLGCQGRRISTRFHDEGHTAAGTLAKWEIDFEPRRIRQTVQLGIAY